MFERPKSGERALLVHLKLKNPTSTPDFAEFHELATSAGAIVVEQAITSRDTLDSKFLIGKGKVEELTETVRASDIELVIFNFSLSPIQERNLEKVMRCRVIDRVGLILDIFASRARTYEGKLQVELAQLQHLSTRLVRGWTHLERQKGGIGLRGPGETQLEVDRRLIRGRIKNIKARLLKVQKQRAQSRRSRQKAELPTVALVGYTNAGKSSLFNLLTNSEVFAKDQLFATLDPTLRQIALPNAGRAILADTVGFIRDLPHELVESFKATLEEVADAQLLLHVIDLSNDLWQEQKLEVDSVLQQIGAMHVPRLEVYNKIDLLEHVDAGIERDHNDKVSCVKISVADNVGIDLLISAIGERLCSDIVVGILKLPPTMAKERAKLYAVGAVNQETIDSDGNWNIEISIQQQLWQSMCGKFKDLQNLLNN